MINITVRKDKKPIVKMFKGNFIWYENLEVDINAWIQSQNNITIISRELTSNEDKIIYIITYYQD